MGQYSKKGLYSGYDKNNKEREALDYYATPPEEVTNILKVMNLEITAQDRVLDPCCGGGHMMKGIKDYFPRVMLAGTDIKDRRTDLVTDLESKYNIAANYGKKYDFLSEDYPIEECEYIIMNPPYSVITPFVNHALDIANTGVLMLGRLQFLEGEKRYNEVLKDNPPTTVYIYVDRIACYKNGDFSIKPNSIQAYAWFYWDKYDDSKETKVKFLRRVGK